MDIYEYNSSGHRNNICSDKTHTMVVKEGEKQLYERVRCQYLFKQETTVVSLHTLFNFNNNFVLHFETHFMRLYLQLQDVYC